MNYEGDELVELCLNGDAAAWANLVEQYKSLIYRICRLSSISNQDADDLAQEAFIRIWMNLPSYNPQRGSLRSWIASVTGNLRIDRYRSRKRDRHTDSLDEGWENSRASSLSQQMVDLQPTPHDSALSKEVMAIVSEAADKLSPLMRESVILRLVQELDEIEISGKLRIPKGTVKSRVSRGRAQLASLLNPMRAALGVA